MPHEFACRPGTGAKIISVLILVSQLSKPTLSIHMETNFPGGVVNLNLDTFEIPSTFPLHSVGRARGMWKRSPVG